ncbi:Thiosulfate sulfurtransferase GlpE [Dissostichus eleginoides]|uniref:Thiosulfate sulfurtransferase GlpE n=1 Tax=Dissostichus eleginoides TaxID=100907 RepID=A0AAD9CG02_DISEL|nr:Thiosulfate sulfurtransferase GlpE [Dissostichus eleginoides]
MEQVLCVTLRDGTEMEQVLCVTLRDGTEKEQRRNREGTGVCVTLRDGTEKEQRYPPAALRLTCRRLL